MLVTLALASAHRGRPRRRSRGARVDVVGAVLCALGLAGPVLALIEQPLRGWGDPLVFGAGLGGIALLGAFVLWEARAPHPMLDLELFRRRNFAVGNLLTFAMYAGLGVVFFLLVLFLQQVAGWDALEAGLATVPTLDRHVRAVAALRRAGRPHRPAPAHGLRAARRRGGHPVALAALVRPDFLTDVLPPLLVFSLGLSMTVAPLTAAVLADADEGNAGIASAVNNAIARVASAARDRRDRRGGRRAVLLRRSTTGSKASGWTRGRRRSSTQARERSLGTVDAPSLPAAGARGAAARRRARRRSRRSGTGLEIAAGLVALGGVLGARRHPHPREAGRRGRLRRRSARGRAARGGARTRPRAA